MDELGDFDTALAIAAEMGRTRPRPMWVRPRRPLLERFLGRMGGPGVMEGVSSHLELLLAGGPYYIAHHTCRADFKTGERRSGADAFHPLGLLPQPPLLFQGELREVEATS